MPSCVIFSIFGPIYQRIEICGALIILLTIAQVFSYLLIPQKSKSKHSDSATSPQAKEQVIVHAQLTNGFDNLQVDLLHRWQSKMVALLLIFNLSTVVIMLIYQGISVKQSCGVLLIISILATFVLTFLLQVIGFLKRSDLLASLR